MEKTLIYELSRDGVPFYVGKTYNPKSRLDKHKRTHGNDIELTVIDKAYGDWVMWESFYLELYKSWGFDMVNKITPRNGIMNHTEETKNLISEKLKEKYKGGNYNPFTKHSKESRAKMSKSQQGRIITEEHAEKLKNQPHSRKIVFNGVEYPSLMEAHRVTGHSRGYIRRNIDTH